MNSSNFRNIKGMASIIYKLISMNNNQNNYNYKDLVSKYKFLGLKKGDNIFATTGLGFLVTVLKRTKLIVYAILLKALEIIGEEGTLIVPTYSYTFGNRS